MIRTMPKRTSDEPLFTRAVAFRITDPALWEAVEALIDQQEYPTTFTDIMTIALREHVKAKGLYKPKPKRKPSDN